MTPIRQPKSFARRSSTPDPSVSRVIAPFLVARKQAFTLVSPTRSFWRPMCFMSKHERTSDDADTTNTSSRTMKTTRPSAWLHLGLSIHLLVLVLAQAAHVELSDNFNALPICRGPNHVKVPSLFNR